MVSFCFPINRPTRPCFFGTSSWNFLPKLTVLPFHLETPITSAVIFTPPSDFQKQKPYHTLTFPSKLLVPKKPINSNIPNKITGKIPSQPQPSIPSSHNHPSPEALPKPGYPSLLSPLLCVGSCKAKANPPKAHPATHRRGKRFPTKPLGEGIKMEISVDIPFKRVVGIGIYLENPRWYPFFWGNSGLLVAKGGFSVAGN